MLNDRLSACLVGFGEKWTVTFCQKGIVKKEEVIGHDDDKDDFDVQRQVYD